MAYCKSVCDELSSHVQTALQVKQQWACPIDLTASAQASLNVSLSWKGNDLAYREQEQSGE